MLYYEEQYIQTIKIQRTHQNTLLGIFHHDRYRKIQKDFDGRRLRKLKNLPKSQRYLRDVII